MKFLVAALFACCVAASAAESTPPVVQIDNITAPSAAGARGPAFALSPDGTPWLIWLERAATGHVLRCASFDSTANRWRVPHLIASGPEFVLSMAETPQLTAGPSGQLTAAWPVMTGGEHHVVYSVSFDGAATWSRPAPLTRETPANEFAALTTLADGRVLAAWLDGRATTKTTRATRLYARVLDQPGTAPNPAPDALVDSLVCDCCSLAFAPFPDGSSLLVYRGRTEEEIRDIHVTRFNAQGWAESRVLNPDLWRLAGCPVNGPRLAVDGGRVSVAWFTAADGEAKVLLSTSPDAGARFLMPLKVDHGHPAGHVDTVLLHDGAALALWLENPSTDPKAPPAGLWLRRASPQSSLDESVLLSSAAATQPVGFPRALLIQDFSGDSLNARLLVAYMGTGGLHTLSVTIPESELLASATDNCNCAAAPAQLVGFSVRGTVVGNGTASGAVTVKHPEFPGLLPAGTHDFRATPSVLAALPAGREFLGRIERRTGEWWLFDVRLLVAAPEKNAVK